MFDHMQPGAVTLVIMGLDHGIGYIPTVYSKIGRCNICAFIGYL